MAGTWKTPRTWVDGETPTGAQFNAEFRDNLAYLKDAPTFDGNVTIIGGLTATTATVNGSLTVAGQGNFGTLVVNTLANIGTLTVTSALNALLKTYSETRVAASVAADTGLYLDCAQGTYFTATLTASCTVVLQNPPPAGRALGVTVIFTGNGAAATAFWQASVKWPGGLPPTITTTAGKRDVISLITEDGGVTWFGIVVGQNY